MAIKEILDKIRSQLGADAPAEVSALLADATREVTDILDTLSSANRESASRKTKIRELEKELEIEKEKTEKMNEKQKEFEQFKSKAEQYDQYLANQNQEIPSSWKAANTSSYLSTTSLDNFPSIVTPYSRSKSLSLPLNVSKRLI